MRRSARGDNSAFSLFPFLAVLLCTMGSLVVLLAAMAYVARDKAQREAEAVAAAAEQAAQQADTPERREAEAALAQAERLAAEMKRQAELSAEQLRQQQEHLSNLEDHLRRLRDEADRLTAETAELFAVEDGYNTDERVAREELERRNRLIGELQDEIEELKHAATGRERKYAVVSLRDERTGTLRPPIYFECTKSGVTLQPEGIELTHEDLVAAKFSSPMAAAARAVSRYYEEHPEARAANEVGAPYPLLLVRPGGVPAYYRTRDALATIGADFGYQPIGADWPLEYDPPNPVLAQWVNEEVLLAREERRGLAQIIPQLASELANADPVQPTQRRVSLRGDGGDGSQRDGVLVSRADPEANNPFEGLTIVGTAPRATGNNVSNGEPQRNPFAPVSAGGGGGSNGPEAGGTPGTATAIAQQANASQEPSATPDSAPATGTLAAGSAQPSQQRDAGPNGGGGSESEATTAAAGQASQSATAMAVAAPPASPPSATPPGEGQQAGSSKPGPTRSGIPMVRSIRLYVTADQVVVLPDRAQSPEEGALAASASQRIDFAERPTSAQINQVVAALKSHADSWGIAGKGMYWDPRLVLNVSADGQRRASDLTRLLQAAGLKVQAKPLATAAKPAPRGGADATR
ncbi:hypothetical protein MalM25_22550 [Planctomycetes bacterium MalM25]|nr:hypothetical protein MalM25_22550 [Planctomycetes bacterium MalM25]